MIALLAVILFDLSPTLCDEVEQELIEYNEIVNELGGRISESDIERIVNSCRANWEEDS